MEGWEEREVFDEEEEEEESGGLDLGFALLLGVEGCVLVEG